MLRILFSVVAYAVIAFPLAASAQGSEAPLGVHPQGSQTHWYDESCCNLTDCARIKVHIKDDHYIWTSWKWPQYEVRVPVDREKAAAENTNIMRSKDGDFHGCETLDGMYQPYEYRDNSYTPPVWTPTGVRALCLYVPDNT